MIDELCGRWVTGHGQTSRVTTHAPPGRGQDSSSLRVLPQDPLSNNSPHNQGVISPVPPRPCSGILIPSSQSILNLVHIHVHSYTRPILLNTYKNKNRNSHAFLLPRPVLDARRPLPCLDHPRRHRLPDALCYRRSLENEPMETRQSQPSRLE